VGGFVWFFCSQQKPPLYWGVPPIPPGGDALGPRGGGKEGGPTETPAQTEKVFLGGVENEKGFFSTRQKRPPRFLGVLFPPLKKKTKEEANPCGRPWLFFFGVGTTKLPPLVVWFVWGGGGRGGKRERRGGGSTRCWGGGGRKRDRTYVTRSPRKNFVFNTPTGTQNREKTPEGEKIPPWKAPFLGKNNVTPQKTQRPPNPKNKRKKPPQMGSPRPRTNHPIWGGLIRGVMGKKTWGVQKNFGGPIYKRVGGP